MTPGDVLHLFGDALFLTDWVNSEESQAILDYQRHDLEDYLEEVRRELGAARHVVERLGPSISPVILAYSRHQAAADGKPARLPNALRVLATVRRGLRAAKSYL